ncbi:MAG: MBL fold metallo-hydrolase [Elusimicrobiales bacterium]
MRATFLGTNGWYDTALGNTTCALAETETEYIVLDAGFGIAKLDELISGSKPVYIFISHTHIDHVCGLHALNKFAFPQGVKICVARDMKSHLKRLLDWPYSLPPSKLKMKTEIIDYEAMRKLAPHFSVYPLVHSAPCRGLRVEAEGKVLSYAPDTGLCPALYRLCKNADLMIAECSYLPGERIPHWPHLNPQDAAIAAKRSGAKKLYLTHFEAKRYNSPRLRAQAQATARKIFKNSFAAKDGVSVCA